ncbi:hypothetical protein J43TS3_33480 [Ornithinibacillus bavariensis]|uniref:Yip1 domain-containing protein n=2 Tax=Ornithinibacillus bavariensis TaxID=545502 RepID=A0A920C9Q6_9BACI|nr:hypothetical protein J43TS3_33480 [Ornithinibacillus bavariensis]
MGEVMTYTIQLFKLLFAVDDHIFRIGKAEVVKIPWRTIFILSLFGIIVYAVMGAFGIGTSPISSSVSLVNPAEFELRKLWFVFGRVLYAVSFVLFILFIPPLIFYTVTKIPFKKLLVMQVVVLFVLLLERIVWIPIHILIGLDWFVSPFSFGIIASYVTDQNFIIYFFGSITLFQIWIMVFQVKLLTRLSGIHKGWIYSLVILFHIAIWTVTAVLAFTDILIINRWFG